MRRTLLLVVAVLIAAGVSTRAGELDHLYVPYGYSLPWLSQGEYLLTGNYVERHGSAVSYFEEPPDTTWSDDDPVRTLEIDGLLAVTDNVLVHGRLTYDFSRSSGGRSSGNYWSRYHYDAMLVPSVEAVLRPWRWIEVSAVYAHQSRTVSSTSSFYPMTSTSSNKTTSWYYRLRLAWSGRL